MSWVAICREGLPANLVQSSAMLYAFPKWAVYGVSSMCLGFSMLSCNEMTRLSNVLTSAERCDSHHQLVATSRSVQGNDPSLPGKKFWVPVFTGQDLCGEVRTQAPFTLPAGGDCGAAFTQLQPVMPQAAGDDVRAGETFFVLDVSRVYFFFICLFSGLRALAGRQTYNCYSQPTATPTNQPNRPRQFYLDQPSRRNFLLAALIATGTLWDHDGLGTPTPYIVGRWVGACIDEPNQFVSSRTFFWWVARRVAFHRCRQVKGGTPLLAHQASHQAIQNRVTYISSKPT